MGSRCQSTPRNPVAFVLVLFLSVSAAAAHASAQNAAAASSASNVSDDRGVSLKQLPANIVADQKRIWFFPVSLAHGEHVWPTVGVLAPTAVFIATDAHSAPPFRNTTNFHDFANVFSGTNSAAMIAALSPQRFTVSAGFTTIPMPRIRHCSLEKPWSTAITGRRQPVSYFGNGPYTRGYFHGSHNPFQSGGFYSDHAMAVTAVAAVLSHRYRQHRSVPFVAYAGAGAISFSRITTNDHFPADVLFGGALGLVIARYAVLPGGCTRNLVPLGNS